MSAPRIDDPDLPLSEIMSLWPATVHVFFKYKMICPGCAIGPFHTVEDACREYHLDRDDLIAELKAAASGD